MGSNTTALATGARETLHIAGLDLACVERVDYLGGSSLMTFVSQILKNQFPQAVHSYSEVFAAVADALAMAADDPSLAMSG